MSQLSDLALQQAITQIGQKENPLGSNWGSPVKEYLASVGIDFPASWCLGFIHWCFDKAAVQLNIPNPMYKTGGVLAEWYHRQTNAKTSNPAIGDVFIMDFGHGLGHTGIIESIDADGTLNTIEGNTNNDGSRNGVEVERKTRNQKSIKGYLSF